MAWRLWHNMIFHKNKVVLQLQFKEGIEED
jgi:hypothetical protein